MRTFHLKHLTLTSKVYALKEVDEILSTNLAFNSVSVNQNKDESLTTAEGCNPKAWKIKRK